MVDFEAMRDRIVKLGGVKILNRRDHAVRVGRYVSVARPSVFGNPFIVGIHGDQGECCDKHALWLDTGEGSGNPNATEHLRQEVLRCLPKLKGLDLECWCWPKRCHAEKLANLANFVAQINEISSSGE